MGSSRFSRSSRFRPSRYLFVLLAALLGVGAGVFLHKHSLRHQIVPGLAALNVDPIKSPAFLDPKPAAMLSGGPPSTRPALTPDPKRGTRFGPGNTSPAPSRPLQAPARPAAAPAPAGTAEKLLVDAKAKSDSGDLAAARAILNEPLVSGRLVESDAQAVRRSLIEINQKLVFSAKPYPSDPLEAPVIVEPGMRLQKLANQYDITWPLICRVNGYEPTDAAHAASVPATPSS